MITGFVTQDTIRPGLVIRIDPGKLIPDSVLRRLDEVPAHIRNADSAGLRRKRASLPEIVITDTTSVCSRNLIADYTYSDSSSFVRNPVPYPQGQFPFHLVDKIQTTRGQPVAIIKPLREGISLPAKPLHSDWITGLLFLSAILWLLVRLTTKGPLQELKRFILLRRINEPSSRDTGSLFYWQSTVLNFVSFLVLALFAYCAAAYNEITPSGLPGLLSLLEIMGIVIAAVTSRHLICLTAGNLSGQNEMFNEYLITIYQSYRYGSVFIYWLIILMLYTGSTPSEVHFIAGAAILGIFYIYRVLRLLFIFIKRNISILYLFLYLCALEILPVLIIIKYLSGLFGG
ncbi:MAG TPA: DUF4271 domain-containing protein [Bacteroidales bacterium]|jgi:hypothetical protein|nr:DUF4271 domain-containing protein [Bacteroidales bacterium]